MFLISQFLWHHTFWSYCLTDHAFLHLHSIFFIDLRLNVLFFFPACVLLLGNLINFADFDTILHGDVSQVFTSRTFLLRSRCIFPTVHCTCPFRDSLKLNMVKLRAPYAPFRFIYVLSQVVILPPTQLPKLQDDFNISKEVRGPEGLIEEIHLALEEYMFSPFFLRGWTSATGPKRMP